MRQGLLRFHVNELAGGDEPAGHRLGHRAIQRSQLGTNLRRKLARIDVLCQRRIDLHRLGSLGRLRLIADRAVPLGTWPVIIASSKAPITIGPVAPVPRATFTMLRIVSVRSRAAIETGPFAPFAPRHGRAAFSVLTTRDVPALRHQLRPRSGRHLFHARAAAEPRIAAVTPAARRLRRRVTARARRSLAVTGRRAFAHHRAARAAVGFRRRTPITSTESAALTTGALPRRPAPGPPRSATLTTGPADTTTEPATGPATLTTGTTAEPPTDPPRLIHRNHPPDDPPRSSTGRPATITTARNPPRLTTAPRNPRTTRHAHHRTDPPRSPPRKPSRNTHRNPPRYPPDRTRHAHHRPPRYPPPDPPRGTPGTRRQTRHAHPPDDPPRSLPRRPDHHHGTHRARRRGTRRRDRTTPRPADDPPRSPPRYPPRSPSRNPRLTPGYPTEPDHRTTAAITTGTPTDPAALAADHHHGTHRARRRRTRCRDPNHHGTRRTDPPRSPPRYPPRITGTAETPRRPAPLPTGPPGPATRRPATITTGRPRHAAAAPAPLTTTEPAALAAGTAAAADPIPRAATGRPATLSTAVPAGDPPRSPALRGSTDRCRDLASGAA